MQSQKSDVPMQNKKQEGVKLSWLLMLLSEDLIFQLVSPLDSLSLSEGLLCRSLPSVTFQQQLLVSVSLGVPLNN